MLPSCATKNYAGKKYPLKVKSERWAEVVNLLFQYASKLCNQKSCIKIEYALKEERAEVGNLLILCTDDSHFTLRKMVYLDTLPTLQASVKHLLETEFSANTRNLLYGNSITYIYLHKSSALSRNFFSFVYTEHQI
jgi:hypothetical protein